VFWLGLQGVHNNTFYIYSSDHGFQLGELNLPLDKRNVYEFDIKASEPVAVAVVQLCFWGCCFLFCSCYSVLIKVELYAVKKRVLKSDSKRERGRREGDLVTMGDASEPCGTSCWLF
jgi:hypothetical protein